MIEAKYRLDLAIQGPLLSKSAGDRLLGVDAAMTRDNNQPVFFGSLIRGNSRHALKRFAKALRNTEDLQDRIERWFGGDHSQDTSGDDDLARSAGAAEFDFYWRPTESVPEKVSERRHRIAITESGAVAAGALQVIESPFPSGSVTTFSGHVYLSTNNDAELVDFEKWMSKAWQYIDAIGAFKGTGFGRVLRCQFSRIAEDREQSELRLKGNHTRIRFEARADRPLLLTGFGPPLGNRLVSNERISGAVLKGALARKLAGAGTDLQDALSLDELVFTDALPGPTATPHRPLPTPFSLAMTTRSDGSAICVDLADFADAVALIEGAAERLSPIDEAISTASAEAIRPFIYLPGLKSAQYRLLRAAFQELDTEDQCNLGALNRILRVRTAIDAGSNSSHEGHLFSEECILPDGLAWSFDVDLSGIDPARRDNVRKNLLASLGEGLSSIGKTRARCEIRLRKANTRSRAPSWSLHQETCRILVASPVRMLPATLAAPGTNGHVAMHEAYANYWRYISGGQLQLSHYFGQQKMTGGRYYAHRFRKSTGSYLAEFLTVPGSVFVLKKTDGAKDDSVCALLDDWVARGLPDAQDRANDDWRSNPFIRENGYGEIVINYPLVGADLIRRSGVPGAVS